MTRRTPALVGGVLLLFVVTQWLNYATSNYSGWLLEEPT